jgi:hypothetical protein
MTNPKKPKKAILYYPTIAIPTDDWLRQAVLYWDEVSSIVPEHWERNHKYTKDISYLRDEEEFRAIRPEALTQSKSSSRARTELAREFETILASAEFKRVHNSRKSKKTDRLQIPQKTWELWKIHESKMWRDIQGKLGAIPDTKHEWYLVDKSRALLYMSLLAKYLADIDAQSTVPGTDDPEYEKLIYDAESPEKGIACIDIRFINALPIPRESVELPAIVAFKRKRGDELLSFRERVEELQNQLSQVDQKTQIKDIMTKFNHSIRKDLNNLSATLKDASLEATSGCFKTIINVKSPTLWTTLGAAAFAGLLASHPLAWTLGGLAVAGGVEVTHHWISKRNERRMALRNDSVAYLYHANKDGLIDFA